MIEVKEKYAIPRRTIIEEYDEEIDDEDLIPQEDMVIIITRDGYIKRTPLDDYRQQHRGGKGLAGINTKEEDFVKNLFVANTHDELLCFTTNGLAYKIKTWKLPLGSRNTKGKPLVNILNVEGGVSISETILLSEKDFEDPEKFLVFAFSNGKVRRSALSHFQKIQSNGKIAFSVEEKYTLIGTCCCTEDDDVILASNRGQAIRFSTKLLREIKSRKSVGGKGFEVTKERSPSGFDLRSGKTNSHRHKSGRNISSFVVLMKRRPKIMIMDLVNYHYLLKFLRTQMNNSLKPRN